MAIGKYAFVFDNVEAPARKVFLDPTQRRRKLVLRLLLTSLIGMVIWLAIFVAGLVSIPGFERVFQRASTLATAGFDVEMPTDPDGATSELRPMLAAYRAVADKCASQTPPAMAAMAAGAGSRMLFTHFPSSFDDPGASLEASCDAPDVLMPEWFTIGLSSGHVGATMAPAEVREALETYAKAHRAESRLLPVISFDLSEPAASLVDGLKGGAQSQVALEVMADAAQGIGATGLCLDVSDLGNGPATALQPFYVHMQRVFRERGLESCVVVSAEQDTWRNPAIIDRFDRVVVQMFRQAWVGSVPSPVADATWFVETATQVRDTIAADRLVVALGTFGASWTMGKPTPEVLTYAETIRRVSDAGAQVRFSPETGNSFAMFRDEAGNSQRVWFADATTTYNQLLTLEDLGLGQIALWDLGGEDPTLWPMLAASLGNRSAIVEALETVDLTNSVAYVGEGPFLKVLSAPEQGQRDLRFSDEGQIVDASYQSYPQPFRMQRYGKPAANQLVLTFDDGPDPIYTAQILDILKEKNVPGAFFVVGTRAMAEPTILQRMFDEGHEIGSHTFSHPRMEEVSHARAEFEHSMMSRLISGYTGHDTLLYREPYLRASGPVRGERVVSLAEVQAQGAIIAGMEVVPPDWTGLSAEEILRVTLKELKKTNGNVLLFHDGGGKREETVKAVALVIDELQARGYEFTSLGALLGMSPAELMPSAGTTRPIFDKASFSILSGARGALVALFWVVLVLGVMRALWVFALSLKHRKQIPIHDHFEPKVSVVIPAHNEQNGIADCIRSVLASDYGNFDVIVVDDGSVDDTFEQALEFSLNPRVKVLAQLNSGKSGALNAAIRNTDAEILVCIDADTEVRPDAIRHLSKHFFNPRIGAVAGKISVSNRVNLLTRLQALEYVTAQNFERRAFDLIDGMMVVPGAIGAWRTQALREVGGYSSETLTEDTDATIAVHRAGYRVSYEDNAVAYTEAPESIRMLMRQRLRWSVGMLQSAWKHKRSILSGKAIGSVTIPDLLIFGYLFAMLAPLADMLFLAFLINVGMNGMQIAENGFLFSPATLGYAALPLVELFVAAFALKSDRDEKMWLILLFPFQRFFYRQILYVSAIRALARAISGGVTNWGRQRRRQRATFAQQATA